jgi:hypothetical protein
VLMLPGDNGTSATDGEEKRAGDDGSDSYGGSRTGGGCCAVSKKAKGEKEARGRAARASGFNQSTSATASCVGYTTE